MGLADRLKQDFKKAMIQNVKRLNIPLEKIFEKVKSSDEAYYAIHDKESLKHHDMERARELFKKYQAQIEILMKIANLKEDVK